MVEKDKELIEFRKRAIVLLANKFISDYNHVVSMRFGEEIEHYWETWARSTIRETELRRSVWMAVMQIKLKQGQHRSNG
jgi:hypothetical protein